MLVLIIFLFLYPVNGSKCEVLVSRLLKRPSIRIEPTDVGIYIYKHGVKVGFVASSCDELLATTAVIVGIEM